MAVILETSLGDLTIDLHTDICPKATRNFLKLCKLKYYNNQIIFNVQKDFMIQMGDPTGTGRGGECVDSILYRQSRFFPDEFSKKLRHKKIGTVSYASKGSDTNGSQFFITTGPNLDYLDDKHTIFGEVSEGLETLQAINSVFVDAGGRPLQNIRIRHTIILDDPFPDPKLLTELIPAQSPVATRDEFDIGYLAADEELGAEDRGLTPEEIAKRDAAKEAGSRATALEMLGDLPTADIAPPENIIFVAQIHPVTKDEDLQLIFSRFGPIKSCEIIRDWKTGASLQYAFIEFETAEQAEAAYFKMDNVLIDDRRIKVDFSQSVSKLWNSWRRGDKDMSGQVDTSNSNSRGGGGPGGRGGGGAGRVSGNLVLKDKYQQKGSPMANTSYLSASSSRAPDRSDRSDRSERGDRSGGGRDRDESSRDRRPDTSSRDSRGGSSSSSSSRRRSRSRSPRRR